MSPLCRFLLTGASRRLGQDPRETRGQGCSPGSRTRPSDGHRAYNVSLDESGIAPGGGCCLLSSSLRMEGSVVMTPVPILRVSALPVAGARQVAGLFSFRVTGGRGPTRSHCPGGYFLWPERPCDFAGTKRMWQKGCDWSSQDQPPALWSSLSLRTLCFLVRV